jgi:hypothetical protein
MTPTTLQTKLQMPLDFDLQVWNLKVGEEDVVQLFEQKHLPF